MRLILPATLMIVLLASAVPVQADEGFILMMAGKGYSHFHNEHRYDGDFEVHIAADGVWAKPPLGDELEPLVETDSNLWRLPPLELVPLDELWAGMAGQWQVRIVIDGAEHDYAFTVSPVETGDYLPVPSITSPAPGAIVLRDHTFTWDSNGAHATADGFRIGVDSWQHPDGWLHQEDGWKTDDFGPLPPAWEPPAMWWTLEQDANEWSVTDMPLGEGGAHLGYGAVVDIISDIDVPQGAPNLETVTLAASFDEVDFTIIPEPASLAILALGGLALLRRRVRQ